MKAKLNKPFIRKLALKLKRLRHEKHYDQGVWAEKTSCGTAACLAGHAVLLANGNLDFNDVVAYKCRVPKLSDRAIDIYGAGKKLLGLTARQARRLFGGGYRWPGEFGARYDEALRGGGERPSRVAAAMLDAIADGTVKL